MANWERFVRRFNRVAEMVVIIAFATLIVDVAAAVFFRYVLNDSIVWAEEMARYLFVWITFVGGGLGVGRNIHVGVDSIVEILPVQLKQVVEICVELMIVVFVVALIYVGAQFAWFGMKAGALLLPIPMGVVYLAVPVGGAVMLVNLLSNVVMHLHDYSRGAQR
ncbi:MAG: TRAP transporter small permease [Betaproteobacteria bacterium]|nr:TRAP transporter small permease [Betaproteobacteria bacterium]